MFQLDDQFLTDVGLATLPDDQKQAFLQHIYQELEYRVGVRLSEGLSDEQLAEFESFIDRDDEKVNAWVTANAPDYANDQAYQQLKSSVPEGTDEGAILAEFASLKWLGLNRPDYRQVVAAVLDELKKEIRDNREAFLGSGGGQAPQPPVAPPAQDDYTPAA
jgi:hypothetical protein